MSVVHFEIPADDVKRAQVFYGKAFGWQFDKYPGMDYFRVGTTPSDKNGMPKAPGAIKAAWPSAKGPLRPQS